MGTVSVVHNHLAEVLAVRGDLDGAIAELNHSLQLQPSPVPHCNLAKIYRHLGRIEEAVGHIHAGLKVDSNHLESLMLLADLCQAQLQYADAAGLFQRVIAGFYPKHTIACNNLGFVLHRMGRYDDAITAYRQALEINPDATGVHTNLAIALLVKGDWKEGWDQYEYRWRSEGFPDQPRNYPGRPLWEGQDISGQTILVYAEQGFGDTIQFCRLLTDVAARGARVMFECQPELKRLSSSTFPRADLVARRGRAPTRFSGPRASSSRFPAPWVSASTTFPHRSPTSMPTPSSLPPGARNFPTPTAPSASASPGPATHPPTRCVQYAAAISDALAGIRPRRNSSPFSPASTNPPCL